MKPCFLVALFLLAFVIPAHAQGPDWKWAIAGGGHDITNDKNGNIYVVGGFRDTFTVSGVKLTATYDFDIYLAKYDPSGNLLWIKHTPGSATEYAMGIAVDNAGNIYVNSSVGGISNPVFGGIPLTTNGDEDFLLAKYDNVGNLLWARTAGGQYRDNSMFHGIECDGAGNIYVTGRIGDDCILDNDTLKLVGQEDAVVIKYDGNGNVLWYRGIGGLDVDRGFGIAIDNSGNVFATGFYQDSAMVGTQKLFSSQTSGQSYLVKWDAAGQMLWAKNMGGDFGANVAIDAAGAVYVTGHFEYNTTTRFGLFTLTADHEKNIFLVKYDNDGNEQWVRQTGKYAVYQPDVDTDPLGNVYLSCDNILLEKYTTGGTLRWTAAADGPVSVNNISVDNNGNLYLTGMLDGPKTTIATHPAITGPLYVARLSPFPASVPEVAQRSINLYPNPANSRLHIEGATLKIYSITDVLGRKMLEGEAVDNVIDIGTLPPGNYTLNLSLDEQVMHAKFVKE